MIAMSVKRLGPSDFSPVITWQRRDNQKTKNSYYECVYLPIRECVSV